MRAIILLMGEVLHGIRAPAVGASPAREGGAEIVREQARSHMQV
ncbi:MAG: hypothetical protein WBJ75_07130 [Pseudohongiellaceae bacterium]